jgi:hypothetical protein
MSPANGVQPLRGRTANAQLKRMLIIQERPIQISCHNEHPPIITWSLVILRSHTFKADLFGNPSSEPRHMEGTYRPMVRPP